MATFYWSYGGVTQALDDLTNLWQDNMATIPALSLPGSGDDLIFLALSSTMPTSNGGGITALYEWDSSGAAIGTQIDVGNQGVTSPIISVSFGGVTVGVSGDNTSNHQWYGGLGTVAAFVSYGAGGLFVSGTLTANYFNFNDTSGVTLNGGATIDASSVIVFGSGTYIAGGPGTIYSNGNLTITSPVLSGLVSPVNLQAGGDITFNNVGANQYLIVQDAVNFNANAGTSYGGGLPGGGTISGNINFNSGSTLGNSIGGTVACGGNINLTSCTVGGEYFTLNATGNINLDSVAGYGSTSADTYITSISCVNITITGTTNWDANMPPTGTISGNVTFDVGTTLAGAITCGGNVVIAAATLTGTPAINSAVNVSISGVPWSGSLTCSGNLTLDQTGTGPFSVGGEIIITASSGGGPIIGSILVGGVA